jgi:hypothetical protein
MIDKGVNPGKEPGIAGVIGLRKPPKFRRVTVEFHNTQALRGGAVEKVVQPFDGPANAIRLTPRADVVGHRMELVHKQPVMPAAIPASAKGNRRSLFPVAGKEVGFQLATVIPGQA